MKALRLRCEKCGTGNSVAYEDLKIAKIDWHDAKAVEKFAGLCLCNGQYKINAPVRCPNCKSLNLKLDKIQPRMFID